MIEKLLHQSNETTRRQFKALLDKIRLKICDEDQIIVTRTGKL